ncbi:MAG: TRAP transporter substrate-binding protein [Alphaproteobacteria bacterium]|nr:TRAP transporter substrate-binding protein [Alphaproteobacteria bacterium]MBU0799165.1 TRAP transporter substrate-binding protein [Alphaproteobacteria bacterium]MBU0888806.1 TRAP transporter substrate-binding protein [Alphaproteobacteria bacterium]MBU1813826.1 TRAP transporter substrate-binding protein [Alphaproteobacteria bacterium]
MRKLFIASALLLSGGLALPAQAQMELKFGHVGGPGSLFELSANEFAKRANAKLGDKAKVVTFGSSQLGGDKELMQKLKLGTVEFALPSTVMSSEVDAFGMFEMPYLVKNRDHMKKIEAEVIWPTLAPMAEAKGFKILGVWENGFRHITNNARPIVKPEDLKGIKLRVPQGKWRVKMFQIYGSNPSPMALSEVFVALQTGVMDGQENPLTQIYSSKFQEVQKYLSMTGHVYTPAYIVAGARKWASLPADVRSILEATAKETQAYVYEQAEKLEGDLLAKIKAAGVTVNEADKDAFIAASKDVYTEFGQDVKDGAAMVDKAIALGAGL